LFAADSITLLAVSRFHHYFQNHESEISWLYRCKQNQSFANASWMSSVWLMFLLDVQVDNLTHLRTELCSSLTKLLERFCELTFHDLWSRVKSTACAWLISKQIHCYFLNTLIECQRLTQLIKLSSYLNCKNTLNVIFEIENLCWFARSKIKRHSVYMKRLWALHFAVKKMSRVLYTKSR